MNLKAFGDLESCENVSSNAVAVEMKEVFSNVVQTNFCS